MHTDFFFRDLKLMVITRIKQKDARKKKPKRAAESEGEEGLITSKTSVESAGRLNNQKPRRCAKSSRGRYGFEPVFFPSFCVLRQGKKVGGARERRRPRERERIGALPGPS